MHDDAGANEIETSGVNEAGGENMKVVGDAIGDDRVAGVVTALAAGAQITGGAEDIDELAFAFIAPLSAKHDGGHSRGTIIGQKWSSR